MPSEKAATAYRRQLSKIARPQLEEMMRRYRPESKPWQSKVGDLRDRLAVVATFDPATASEIERLTDGQT